GHQPDGFARAVVKHHGRVIHARRPVTSGWRQISPGRAIERPDIIEQERISTGCGVALKPAEEPQFLARPVIKDEALVVPALAPMPTRGRHIRPCRAVEAPDVVRMSDPAKPGSATTIIRSTQKPECVAGTVVEHADGVSG